MHRGPAGQAQPIRLDVPAFVGLAERGPLNQPTPLEDINQYLAIFGGDLVLAQSGGVPVYARLPATVKAFFDNGGLRCYVVRVAGPNALAARWLVPGLRRWRPDGTIEEVFAGASWPGAWSAGVTVGTQLLRQPLAVTGDYVPATADRPGTLPLAAASALAVLPGDLIELDLGPSWPGLYVSPAAGGAGGVTVPAGAEVPVSLSAAVGLPAPVPVVSATLLRFDVVVQLVPPGGGAGQQLELWPSLSFNPPAPAFWLDVTQQAPAPDLTRSLFLRADPAALGGSGVFVPLGMDELGTSAEFADAAAGSPPDPGVWAGDDDLSAFDPVTLFLDPHLLDETVYDLLDDASQYTVLSASPIQLTGIHSLIGVDEVAMISIPDAAHLGWTSSLPVPGPPPPRPPAPLPPPADPSAFRSCVPSPPAPVVTGVAPASGPAIGGTAVTVTGSGLSGGAVTFGATAAASSSCTSTACTAISPPGTGTVDVTVTTAGGTSSASAADQFIYQATPLPYPVQDDPMRYDPAGLIAVQVALIQLCAARADAVALLSLPAHYHTADVLALVAADQRQRPRHRDPAQFRRRMASLDPGGRAQHAPAVAAAPAAARRPGRRDDRRLGERARRLGGSGEHRPAGSGRPHAAAGRGRRRGPLQRPQQPPCPPARRVRGAERPHAVRRPGAPAAVRAAAPDPPAQDRPAAGDELRVRRQQ